MRRNTIPGILGIALLASAIVSGCGISDSSQDSQSMQIALQQTQIALQQTQIALQHPTEAPTQVPPEPTVVPTQPPEATPPAAKRSVDPQSYTVADIFDENVTSEDKDTIIQFIIEADQEQINTQRYLDLSYSEHSYAGY